MMDNHMYDLMAQLVQESKSLKRIRGNYQADAGDCSDCKAFWTKMVDDKEDHIEEITGLLKSHLV